MSQFIDYKKRSVTLPPGCKDLIDLLRPPRPPKSGAVASREEKPTVTRGESFNGGFSEIRKSVAKVVESKSEVISLLMSTPDEQLTVGVARQGNTVEAFVIVPHGEDREKALRAFYQRHGLEVSPDSFGHCLYHDTLPLEPEAISDIAIELFREVCGLDEKAEVHFCYYELPLQSGTQ
jgi:hypothetical protein